MPKSSSAKLQPSVRVRCISRPRARGSRPAEVSVSSKQRISGGRPESRIVPSRNSRNSSEAIEAPVMFIEKRIARPRSSDASAASAPIEFLITQRSIAGNSW